MHSQSELILSVFLSAYKISPSVGCKSTNHGPGTTALSCQAPGSLHAGAAAVAVKYQQLIFGKTIFLILFFLKIFLQLSLWNIYRVPDMSPSVGGRIPEIYDNSVAALHIIIQHFCRDSFDLKHGKNLLFLVFYMEASG